MASSPRGDTIGVDARGEHDETRQNGVGRRLQVVSRFEGLRKALLTEAYADHLDKPLAYWALPTDRRLPLALLGRTLRDLLDTPFADFSATPGIGRKKIASLVLLLARAANTDPADLPDRHPRSARRRAARPTWRDRR